MFGYYTRADILADVGDYKLGLADIERAVKLDPKEALYLSLRARLRRDRRPPRGVLRLQPRHRT